METLLDDGGSAENATFRVYASLTRPLVVHQASD
jgi:hypothetical protein